MAHRKRTASHGIPGPPGPAGPRGKTGATGAAGARGAKGERGLKGAASKAVLAPGAVLTQLNEIERAIEDIYHELDIQMTRMSQIQQQVDQLRAKVKALTGNSN